MKYYPWYKKLNQILYIYFNYIRQINAIVQNKGVNNKDKIWDLDMLLLEFEEALGTAEINFIEKNIFYSEKLKNRKQKCNCIEAMGMNFKVCLN